MAAFIVDNLAHEPLRITEGDSTSTNSFFVPLGRTQVRTFDTSSSITLFGNTNHIPDTTLAPTNGARIVVSLYSEGPDTYINHLTLPAELVPTDTVRDDFLAGFTLAMGIGIMAILWIGAKRLLRSVVAD